jgi:hypothetical protein
MNGNTRAKALEERGFDINSLPRVPYVSPPPDQGGSGGSGGTGGGGPCACIPNLFPFIVPLPLVPGLPTPFPIAPGGLVPVPLL